MQDSLNKQAFPKINCCVTLDVLKQDSGCQAIDNFLHAPLTSLSSRKICRPFLFLEWHAEILDLNSIIQAPIQIDLFGDTFVHCK